MADETDPTQPPPKRNRGRFQKGSSGNPGGRPKPRLDAYQERALVRQSRNISSNGHLIRRDGWRNEATGHGTARDRRMLTRYGIDVVTDIEAQQLRRSEFLAAAIIEDGPREAFKRGWHLKCEDKDLDVAICKQAEHLGMDSILIEAAQKENESGGAAIFPVLTGALGDLSEPLDERSILSVEAFHVFEPQELTPVSYEVDINEPGFRRPTAWRLSPLSSGRVGYVANSVIHASRLVIFPGIRVSAQTQPGQREGWGDSCLCRPWQVISDFGLAWGSAATLLHQHGRKTWKKKGLTTMLGQSDGLEQFDRHLAATESAWSTLQMAVIDGDDDVSEATGSLGGLSDVLNEFKVLISAAARRPVSVLMGQSQSGLRTGDDDMINWYATVEGDRKMRWARGHERLVRLMLLATSGPTGGREPKSWAVEYRPLHSPTEKEIADTRYVDMQRADMGINNGMFSADDAAESMYGGDTYSGDIHINWERRKVQQEFDAQANSTMGPDEIEAAMGGEGGGFETEGGDPELDSMEAELDTLEQQLGGPDGDQEAELDAMDAELDELEPIDETDETAESESTSLESDKLDAEMAAAEEPLEDTIADEEVSDDELDDLAAQDDATEDVWDLDDDDEE